MRLCVRRQGISAVQPWGAGGWHLPAVVVTISALMAWPAAGVFEGDVELLRLVAAAQRNNMQRIATWEGSSCVEVSREDPEGAVIRETSVFHFLYSRAHEATRWEWKGQNRYVREGLTVGGKPVAPNWPSDWANEMRKSDAFYVYGENRTKRDGQKQASLVIWPSGRAAEGVQSYSFDPMWYLNGWATVGTDDLAGLLMFYYEKSADPSFAGGECLFRMNRDADLVHFEIRMKDVVNHYVFDPSRGGCVVKYYGDSNATKESHEWSYEQKDNVWIPKTLTTSFQHNVPSADGSTRVTRKITFTENTVNHPVAAAEFSLEKLGLQVGDPVSDHRLGLYYLYGGGEELPSENPDVPGKATPAVAADSSSRRNGATPGGKPAAPEPAPEDANSGHPGSQGATPPAWLSRRTSAAAVVVLALSVSAVLLLLLRRRAKTEARS